MSTALSYWRLPSFWLCFMVLTVQACVSDPAVRVPTQEPSLAGQTIIAADGELLAVSRWFAPEPRAVIIALHGMNDYANAFAGAGDYWSTQGLHVYAYDQRGFGRNQEPGVWPGAAQLADDLRAVIRAAHQAHPGLPLFVLGHSMGGAVVMNANGRTPLDADGIILAAPAIWGGARMPLFYRLSLAIAVNVAPDKTLTGQRARRQSTDNIPILRQMQADPFLIKATTLRSVAGLVRLMGRANGARKHQTGDILFLIGCRDELVPVKAQQDVARDIANHSANRSGVAKEAAGITRLHYPEGWHLLFRDLQAARVWEDIVWWIDQQIAEGDDAASQVTAPFISGPNGAASSCSSAK